MTNQFLETNEKQRSHSETSLIAVKGNERKEKCCNKKKAHVKHINSMHLLHPSAIRRSILPRSTLRFIQMNEGVRE
jgi:hypothetical protein